MSPADELRAAATRLEETAAAASKNVCPSWTYGAVRHISRNCEIGCDHHDPYSSDPAPEDGLDHYGWSRHEDAPWISLMGAETAGPVVALLRAAADAADNYPALEDPDSHVSRMVADPDQAGSYRYTAHLIRNGLDLARVINGTGS